MVPAAPADHQGSGCTPQPPPRHSCGCTGARPRHMQGMGADTTPTRRHRLRYSAHLAHARPDRPPAPRFSASAPCIPLCRSVMASPRPHSPFVPQVQLVVLASPFAPSGLRVHRCSSLSASS
eukprot:7057021-Prymnesium_polylepis.1